VLFGPSETRKISISERKQRRLTFPFHCYPRAKLTESLDLEDVSTLASMYTVAAARVA
jgi:hypothetical protein